MWHKLLGNSSDLHNRKQTNAICDYTEAKDINQAVENKRPPIAMAGIAPALIYHLTSLRMYIMNKDKVKIIRLVLMLTGTIEAYM